MTTEEFERQQVLEFFRDRNEGFFIEVGANDPEWFSQTWALERRGWRGLLVEPMQAFYEKLAAARPGSRVVRAACTRPGRTGEGTLHVSPNHAYSSLVQNIDDQHIAYNRAETVPLRTLDELLAADAPARVDFVSVDVEGTELDVLLGFDLARWRPELVLVEDKLHHWDKHRHMTRNGYRWLRRIGVNNWYVPAAHPARATFGERLRFWQKLWGAPFRRLKRARAARRRAASSPQA